MNSAMKSVRIARKIDRPNTREFIDKLFENFLKCMVTGFLRMMVRLLEE